jgi:hypothetical protein
MDDLNDWVEPLSNHPHEALLDADQLGMLV